MPPRDHPAPLTRVRISGWRSIEKLTLRPPPVCARIGGAHTGKSNLLLALHALLLSEPPTVLSSDVTRGRNRVELEAELADGGVISMTAEPPAAPVSAGVERPPVVLLPAALRASTLAERPRTGVSGPPARFFEVLDAALVGELDDRAETGAAAAASLVRAVEACCTDGVSGLVVLIEEPELHLRPHGQRYLYRLLRRLAHAGNQVIYTTHSPAFLDVARLDEAAFVHRGPHGTHVTQPDGISPTDDFRVLTEFDVSRSELLLARAALLVEGQTEKLTFPYVFEALGVDPDREGISIVSCGGKANIPLFARAAQAARVPAVAVHDRDAPAGRRPNQGMRVLNAEIADVVGTEHAIQLKPDFEAVARLRGHAHKPERAWRSFRSLRIAEMPEPLVRAARLAADLAARR